MSFLQKICLFLCGMMMFASGWLIQQTFAIPPTFDEFASPLQGSWADSQWRVESMFDFGIDPNVTLYENVRHLLYPQYGSGGFLWNIIRGLWFIVIVVFLVVNGIMFIIKSGNADEAQKYGTNLAYILAWSLLFFGSVWLIGVALDLDASGGSDELVRRLEDNVLFQVLTLLKSAAFFVAIVMLIISGIKMLNPSGDESKAQTAARWILNVIIALAFIKLVDFIFFIAAQPDFIGQAEDLIVSVATFLLYVLGAIFVLALIYGWYVMITSWGDSWKIEKVKSIIVGIVLAAVVIFLFLLIMYQLVGEFA